MGRQIRRVPPNWVHPRYTNEELSRDQRGRAGEYRPCFDEDYDTAAEKWIAEFKAWETKPESERYGCKYFWEMEEPPSPDGYRPKFEAEPTWFQVYENVSEGTPVSPPFATEQELIDYLATQGDFSDQKRGTPPPSRQAVERFVRGGGYAPSMVMMIGSEGNRIAMGIHAADLFPGSGED